MTYVTFEATIEPLEWGRSVYTVLPLPDDIMAALGHTARVEGEIAGHPVNLAPARAPVIGTAFLFTGKALLREIGIAPGEIVEIRLRPADPDAVDTPDDVAAALRAAGRSADLLALTPGKRRGLLHPISTAKRADTRARRITALLATLNKPD